MGRVVLPEQMQMLFEGGVWYEAWGEVVYY